MKATKQEIQAIFEKHSSGINAVYEQEMKLLDEASANIKTLFDKLKDGINKVFSEEEHGKKTK